ncbi:MAG: type VI secretion system needle protein Hcp [Tannerella sp.]|jgi:hypothetical protein|nr:type VI secretion system needle protein Hcp [Tannerella sp.]
MSILSLPLAHITAKLVLDGKEYAIDHYKIGFTQAIDYKGKPQHEVKGGQMSVTLEQTGDQTLYEWARKSTALKNGKVMFRTGEVQTILLIEFENAYCVGMTRETDHRDGAKIVLIIAPEIVKANGFEHNNRWAK